MKTYEDLVAVKNNDKELKIFLRAAINEHKQSELYKTAKTAYAYFRKRNITIEEYQKLLYTMSGEAVPDNFSANYKLKNALFRIFILQEVSHLLGNGVTFNDKKTKDRLGGDRFDTQIVRLTKKACWGAVSFGFFNLDHVDIFSVLEFVPFFGEEDGGLHAGLRFWQLDNTKPLRITLYEEDGYTEYIERDKNLEILKPKRTYTQIVRTTERDGDEILDGQNYSAFPIVPLWANDDHQSEFIGLREKLDCHDLIESGFANDLDDASQIYWTLQNTGGMDDIDLAKFVERMHVIKAAVVENEGQAQAHTIEVPYEARTVLLSQLRDSLYRDAMALDTDKITAGNVTATAIEASYENLTLKCDDLEVGVTEFIKRLLDLIGIDDSPTYKRSKIINMAEDTQMVLSAAQYLDDETILKHLPFLNPDEIEDIIKRKTQEEANRYAQIEKDEESEEVVEENPVDENGRVNVSDLAKLIGR